MRFLTTPIHAKTNDENKATPRNLKLPNIILYQYETCPFCCKIRTFLDYYGIEYTKVEVHPIFKREIQFSNYKKVPIVIADDDIQVQPRYPFYHLITGIFVYVRQINDSSFMVSVLQTALLHDGDVAEAMKCYPVTIINQVEERANKYWVMYGNTDDLQSKRYKLFPDRGKHISNCAYKHLF